MRNKERNNRGIVDYGYSTDLQFWIHAYCFCYKAIKRHIVSNIHVLNMANFPFISLFNVELYPARYHNISNLLVKLVSSSRWTCLQSNQLSKQS